MQHPASIVPLGWVDGVLQPLPMVVHRSVLKINSLELRIHAIAMMKFTEYR